ncbi:ABC transporter substrate-binding protein, partial [Paraburkholderia sp. Se-20369]|nr:ABC transporter substrate-binding protein [Paraburkholderia sp. Se-20369]
MPRFSFVRRAVVALTAFAALGAAHAESREVVIAYQDMVVPWRYAQASGEVEKATGYKVRFRKLDSGADVIRALASGSVQLGEAGSSPIAAGLSQGLDISLFWILDNINDAEALVARNGSGVTNVAALKGKKIGVPFVSTSHFHTLVALQAAGVNPNDVKIVNLRPPEVAAAWTRGDIDATYIWDPVLAKVKQSGTVLTTSGQVAKQSGKATFDGFVVSRKFARDNPEFVARFVKVLAAADADYRAHAAAWKLGTPQVAAVAKVS